MTCQNCSYAERMREVAWEARGALLDAKSRGMDSPRMSSAINALYTVLAANPNRSHSFAPTEASGEAETNGAVRVMDRTPYGKGRTAALRKKMGPQVAADAVWVLAATLEQEAADLRQRVIQAAYRPRPMCRDCADRDGTCHDGTKCDPFEAALDRLRAKDVHSQGGIPCSVCDATDDEDCAGSRSLCPRPDQGHEIGQSQDHSTAIREIAEQQKAAGAATRCPDCGGWGYFAGSGGSSACRSCGGGGQL